MSGKLKLLIGGLTLGVLVIFALVGVKSMFTEKEQPPASQMGQDGWEPSYAPPILGLPGSSTDNATGTPTDSTVASTATSQQDVPLGEDEKLDMELIGEPDTTETPTQLPDVESPTETVQTPVEEPATIASLPDEPASVEPPAQPMPAAGTGKLEIVLQAAENGKPLKANVYIQQANGVNVDKSGYTSTAAFNLKPGTYRVSARTEGRGTLTRNITVPAGAVVNEIFPLPAIAQAPAPQPAPVPVTQAPTQPAPQAPTRGTGKIRLVALAADDGSPVPVSFTITRLNGSVVDSVNNVSVAEFVLPTEEFVASFDYQGRQGYKSLVVQGGQTHTHTFNIRAEQPAMQNNMNMPAPPMLDPQMQMQQQPQNVQDMMMQRLQEELQKHLTN